MKLKCDIHDDGQVYISDQDGTPMLHAQIHDEHDTTVQIGGHARRVEIDKLYGPLIFWPIRVSLDLNACEWVIEREFGPEGKWREVARIPGQIDEDFTRPDG